MLSCFLLFEMQKCTFPLQIRMVLRVMKYLNE
jgi:hypothetical protein